MGKNVWDSLGGWYTYVFRLGGGVACVGDIFASRCLAVLRKPAQNELQQVVSLSFPLRFPHTPYFSAFNYKGEHVPCDQNGFRGAFPSVLAVEGEKVPDLEAP